MNEHEPRRRRLTRREREHLRNYREPTSGTVKLPQWFIAISVSCTLASVALTVFTIVFGRLIPVCIFSAISLVGIFLTYMYFKYRIDFDDEGFTQYRLLSRKRRFMYGEITEIRRHPMDMCLYMGNRTVSFDMQFSENADDFMSRVEHEYRALHGGADIPVSKRPARDIFRGHSADRGIGFIAACAVIYILAIGIISAVAGGLVTMKPTAADGKQLVTVQVKHAEKNRIGSRLFIEDTDGTRYELNKAGVLDREERDIILAEGTTLTLMIDGELDEDGLYSIYAITSGERELLTLAERDRYSRMGMVSMLMLLSLLLLTFTVFTVLSIVAGRNPSKHPRLVRLLFKHGYIS